MFGPLKRFGVTYRQNQPGFMIYTRKYYHNFKVAIDNKNWEGAIGSNLKYSYAYIMALKNKVIITDQTDFTVKQHGEWEIPTSAPDIEILYMIVSDNEKKIGMTLGRHVIRDQKEIENILIYKKDHDGVFRIERNFKFPFPNACIQFCFDNNSDNYLTFFSKEQVFRFNYLQEFEDQQSLQIQVLYRIENQCDEDPSYGYFNTDQTKFILTSSQDCLYVDIEKKIEIDLDDREEVANIQAIHACDEFFYVFANKKSDRLGYYFFSINIERPEEDIDYFINWTNKLDIACCDLNVLKEWCPARQKYLKSIIMSFKSIGINTYNVVVIDIETK